MKKVPALIIALFFVLSLSAGAQFTPEEAPPESGSAFSIARMVIAGSIEDREPVGVDASFPSDTEKVYCFLEATDIKTEATVRFVWYHGDTQKAVIELPLGTGSRWRTYSSKKLGGLKGEWKVELQDTDGAVLRTVEFTVE